MVEGKIAYILRTSNGGHIDILERMSLQIDERTGDRIICGVLKKKIAPAQVRQDTPQQNQSTEIERPNIHFYGNIHDGRTALQHKVEQWGQDLQKKNPHHGFLLSIGIDRMSLLNESIGSKNADQILKKVFDRLTNVIGERGFVARIDGDVFGLLATGLPKTDMTLFSHKILESFQAYPLLIEDKKVIISVSIGGTLMTENPPEQPKKTMANADSARQSAKHMGGNCVIMFDDIKNDLGVQKKLFQDVSGFMEALHENRLCFAYHPVMNAKNPHMSFHECLVRIRGRDGHMVGAEHFVPAVEKLGFSRIIDSFALEQAVFELKKYPDLKLSVNASKTSMVNESWQGLLKDLVGDRLDVAQRLIVEITESTMLEDHMSLVRAISFIKNLGCRVALDDFGAGYTAFIQLKDLDVDIVKIDKSFVQNIHDNNNQLFVQTLHALASGINIQTVGEGAESRSDELILQNTGIDFVQGYVYGIPKAERLWLPESHLQRQIHSAYTESPSAAQKESVS